MVWTANVDEIRDENNEKVVLVTFSNGGGKSFKKDFHIKTEDHLGVDMAIQNTIDALNRALDIQTNLPLGTFSMPSPDAISQAQANRNTYASNLALYRHWKSAIDVGVVTALNSTYVALIATLNSTFDISYIDLF